MFFAPFPIVWVAGLAYVRIMGKDYLPLVSAILPRFAIPGKLVGVEPFGRGFINHTFRSEWEDGGVRTRYTHQRINEKVFVRPDELMTNITRVTSHIAKKLAALPDWKRRVLRVVPSASGQSWVRDDEGGWWRTYYFVEETHTLEVASNPVEAKTLGRTVALFQKQLADLPPPRLFETIPSFHDMEKRYVKFRAALEKDCVNRAASVKDEIAFMLANEERGAVLIRSLKNGVLPERICHNDTKMNNILLDDAGGGALCLIDLDTVMPGTGLFDLGDLVRTAASTALEDERDENLVRFDPLMYRALLEGYLGETRGFLTPGETGLLAEAGRCIIQIMALRFLTDYLEGDHYYHTARPGHNLDRCRNQLALLRSLDDQWDAARGIAEELTRAG